MGENPITVFPLFLRSSAIKYPVAMALDSMVAMAAPVTPSFMGKMKMGSRMMLRTPPSATPKLASLE